MTDSVKLKEAIEKTGIKKNFIAKQLGISPQGYQKKENGLIEFKASEISIMKDILNLSAKETNDIFLSKG